MKKILSILFLLFTMTISVMAVTYTSQYPTLDTDHVKATSFPAGGSYDPWNATDHSQDLTGGWAGHCWMSDSAPNEQRFHIDLGSAHIIRRIYYENGHSSGNYTDRAPQNFTFWGSNTMSGTFDDLVYANDEGWTQLTISQSTFDQHVALDQADPKYITVTNTTAYQYYAFKIADNWNGSYYMVVRRIELQTEDGYGAFALVKFNNVTCTKWNELAITKWNNKNIP